MLGMQANPSMVIDQLNSFLRGELSAIETYALAIEKAKHDLVRDQLFMCQKSHIERAQLLREWIITHGGKPAERSGPWGAFARAVEGSAGLFGERAALAVLEQGEVHGSSNYATNLMLLDPETRHFMESQIVPAQTKTQHTVEALRGHGNGG